MKKIKSKARKIVISKRERWKRNMCCTRLCSFSGIPSPFWVGFFPRRRHSLNFSLVRNIFLKRKHFEKRCPVVPRRPSLSSFFSFGIAIPISSCVCDCKRWRNVNFSFGCCWCRSWRSSRLRRHFFPNGQRGRKHRTCNRSNHSWIFSTSS